MTRFVPCDGNLRNPYSLPRYLDSEFVPYLPGLVKDFKSDIREK